jgi:hypothetical protein
MEIKLEFTPKLQIWDPIYLLSQVEVSYEISKLYITNIQYSAASWFMPWVFNWSQIIPSITYVIQDINKKSILDSDKLNYINEDSFWEFNSNVKLKYIFTKLDEAVNESNKRKIKFIEKTNLDIAKYNELINKLQNNITECNDYIYK